MASGDVKLVYAASAALTFTSLNSLASSSTWVAGAESNAVDNTSNLYEDYLIAGKVSTGTTPTAGVIEAWVVALADDTTWPDVFDGTDSAETVTSADIKAAGGKLLAAIPTDTNSSRAYWISATSVASLFGGVCPKKFVVFVTHSTVAALHASAHGFWVTGVYRNVAP